MHPKRASLAVTPAGWQSSKPRHPIGRQQRFLISTPPGYSHGRRLFPASSRSLPPQAEPTEVQEDGSCAGPQTRERGKTTGEGEKHQADKFIFATGPFLSAQTQLQASAQARWRRLLFLEKKKKRGEREEVETEGIRQGLFALKLQTE